VDLHSSNPVKLSVTPNTDDNDAVHQQSVRSDEIDGKQRTFPSTMRSKPTTDALSAKFGRAVGSIRFGDSDATGLPDALNADHKQTSVALKRRMVDGDSDPKCQLRRSH
jgi:hypothetical protein